MIPMRLVIHGSIVAGILATIAHWGYRDATSGVAINLASASSNSIWRPEVCVDWKPRERHFALLMSLTNLGTALSQVIGGSVHEAMAERWRYASAFKMLVAVGPLFTASRWLLMPLLNQLTLSSRKAKREAY
jgi:MFS family permease